MCSETDNSARNPQVVQPLEETVRLLAAELRAARADGRRQRRRLRLMSLVLLTAVALAAWSAQRLFPTAQAQALPQVQVSPMNPDQRTAQRTELLAALPADSRERLEAFEREVEWLTRYMQTWDQGKAGAVVAMMLFRMSQNMDAMPAMEQQMRTMSGQMGALPAIVSELGQINAKLHVITATMDSTMGRAGRMLPWMPFTP